jgi:hypothetical protein
MLQLPKEFEERIRGQFAGEYSPLLESYREAPTTAFRLNRGKWDAEYRDPVSWNSDAFYVTAERRFSADPLWHAGA